MFLDANIHKNHAIRLYDEIRVTVLVISIMAELLQIRKKRLYENIDKTSNLRYDNTIKQLICNCEKVTIRN